MDTGVMNVTLAVLFEAIFPASTPPLRFRCCA